MGRVLSIEIKNRNIKILEGSKNGSSVTIYKSLFLDIEPGSIDDGKIVHMDSVVANIEKALKDNNIKTKNATMILNTNETITRNIDLPLLKNKSETLSMIKNELNQILPVDLNEYKVVYKLTYTTFSDEVEMGNYIVYGLPKTIYEEYIELAGRLKLELIAIDLASNCLDKIAVQKLSINKESLKPGTSVAFIDIGRNISFSVLNDGKDVFSKISSNGIFDIVRNFQSIYDISQEDALKDIERISLIDIGESMADISKLNILEDNINTWIDEFNRYIRYYNSSFKDMPIEKIYIHGSFSKIRDLDEYLESRLNITTEFINEVSNVIYKGNVTRDSFDIKSFFNPLMSLYINRNDINFLTDRKKKHRVRFNTAVMVMAVSVIGVLTIAYHVYTYMVEKSVLEKEIAIFEEYINNAENIKTDQEVVQIKNKLLLLRTYMDEATKLQNAIKSEDSVNTLIFEQVAASMPLGTKINSMSIDSTSIQMQCSSTTRQEVAQFEKNLKQVEFINSVYIPAIVDSTEGDGVNYNYSVVCDIKDVIINEAE